VAFFDAAALPSPVFGPVDRFHGVQRLIEVDPEKWTSSIL
jgi:hypothetical protein